MRSLMPENSKKMTNLRQIARPQVVVLAYDGLCTFEFGVAVEIFGLPRPEFGDEWYRFAVASVDSGELRATGGIRIVTDGDLSLLASADLIVVPGWRGWIHRFRTRSARHCARPAREDASCCPSVRVCLYWPLRGC